MRVQEVRRNGRGTITGVTVPTASAEMLLNYRGTMIRAARTQDVGIMGVELNEIWKRIKIHGIPLAQYVASDFRLAASRLRLVDRTVKGIEKWCQGSKKQD